MTTSKLRELSIRARTMRDQLWRYYKNPARRGRPPSEADVVVLLVDLAETNETLLQLLEHLCGEGGEHG